LERLYQGGKTMEEFVIEFNNFAVQTNFSEADLLEKFKRKIKPSIRERVWLHHNPSDLKEWVQAALDMDRYQRSYYAEYGERRKPYQARAATEPRGNGYQRLPKEVYQQRRKDGCCYRCGKKGHLAKACRMGQPRQPTEARVIQEEMENQNSESDNDTPQDF
jgi:hypothetical protein